MKKTILILCVLLSMTTSVFADFTSRVTIVQADEISKLSDVKLIDTLEDVLVEIEAKKTFHTTSGFKPVQYDEYRDLLKFRLQLLMEIHNRNLEIPAQFGG